LLSFDPKRETAVPRHASTVVVVRDEGGRGVEVLCVLRHARSAFLGGAVVFPGGKVDPSDAEGAWDDAATAPDPRVAEMVAPFGQGAAPVSARTLAIAACRETLEEARIVPVDGAFPEDDVEALHQELAAGAVSGGTLAAALARRGRKLALDALVPWARWVTPEAEQRRFDARFFLLALPEGQRGRHDDHETTQSFWGRPRDVLDRFVRGEIFLAPPTTRTLELLADAASMADATALAREQSLAPICPRFVPDDDAPFLALPGDPAHEEGSLRVAGPTRFVLRDGRFVSEHPPRGGARETT
jgi:8-oxo-dGTP pyrophosphatase MutT (NUDIX family)